MKKILAMSSLLVGTSVWAAAPGSGSLDPSTLVNPNIRPATVSQPPLVAAPATVVRPSAVSSQTRAPLEELSHQIKTLLVNSKAQPVNVKMQIKQGALGDVFKNSQPFPPKSLTLTFTIKPELLTSLLAIVGQKPAASGQTTDDNFGLPILDNINNRDHPRDQALEDADRLFLEQKVNIISEQLYSGHIQVRSATRCKFSLKASRGVNHPKDFLGVVL